MRVNVIEQANFPSTEEHGIFGALQTLVPFGRSQTNPKFQEI